MRRGRLLAALRWQVVVFACSSTGACAAANGRAHSPDETKPMVGSAAVDSKAPPANLSQSSAPAIAPERSAGMGRSAPDPGTVAAREPLVERGANLQRRDVIAVLSQGLPAFLQTVQVEPKLAAGNRFYGWTIVDMAAGPAWRSGVLRVGDVVIRVNGKSVERPDDALAVWQALAVAPELRITFEREGARRELVHPIEE